MDAHGDVFIPIGSHWSRIAAISLALVTFLLAFIVFPLGSLRLHFFQLGIFISAFLFGPAVGGVVGALSSSYNALVAMNNPWIIGGNVILGVGAAYLYTRTTPFKAALGAFAIQLPYLALTDVLFAGMPAQAVGMIALTLLVENVICAYIAVSLTPHLRGILAARI